MKLICAKAGTAEVRVGAQEREFVLADDVSTTDAARKYNSNFITGVDTIDVVCIERKRDRTRDHTGANAQLAAVRGDEHAGQTAR